MAIKIVQTCGKCKTSRELSPTGRTRDDSFVFNPRLGGWKQIEDKDVCPPCYKDLTDCLT